MSVGAWEPLVTVSYQDGEDCGGVGERGEPLGNGSVGEDAVGRGALGDGRCVPAGERDEGSGPSSEDRASLRVLAASRTEPT